MCVFQENIEGIVFVMVPYNSPEDFLDAVQVDPRLPLFASAELRSQPPDLLSSVLS